MAVGILTVSFTALKPTSMFCFSLVMNLISISEYSWPFSQAV